LPRDMGRLLLIVYRYKVLALILTVLVSHSLMASPVKLTLPNNKIVTATWIEGDKAKPAIMVMHGFLQTYSFRATSNIIEGLSSQGFAILGPNLSLGISGRQQSMQCQAAHQHTFEGDLEEMKAWTNWLKAKGYKSFIVVGHSWGSQHGISFVNTYPKVPVKAVIAISLIPPRIKKEIRDEQIGYAKRLLKTSSTALHRYTLSFCKAYTSTAAGYLSYAACDQKKIIKGLGKLRLRKIPVYVVLGSADRRVDADWIATIKKYSRLIVIKGANHFFSSVYELELADKLEEILGQLATQR